jgi:uncharacterized phage-like protein YoqJ
MAEREISCCFSGHRPVRLPWGSNENDPRCLDLKRQIGEKLEEFYARGYRHFYCGMAIGCDMYFAEEVLKLRERHPDVTLEAAVPCDDQAARWHRALQERYQSLLSQCDVVSYVSHSYTPDCMMRRNEFMIDRSSLLLACFAGTGGGTMKTILYAQRSGIETEILEI